MAITLHDVARRAGVSIKTVSNVVHDHPHVRPGTRQRVQEAITELGYRPNLSARSLRSGRSGVLGLALPELSLQYFAELADDVITAAERRGLIVLVEQTRGERLRELDVLSSPRLQLMDGLLFSPLSVGAEDMSLLDLDTPLVLLGERVFDPSFDHVTMRNVEAARAATEHLLAAGRRRIAVVGTHPGEVIGSGGLRLRGYREALDAAGIAVDERLLAPAGAWHRRQGAQAMTALIASGAHFDAVFAFNDSLALGALHSLQEARIDVPGDVAVIGFDNSDDGLYSTPTLTTVDPGRREIAELALDALLTRIADPGAPVRHVEVDYGIVVRGTTPG